mmetsp:Transcript_73959/g.190857  ORF Transcript_73959/g.190857 Transcript_73959/m.190857 type:complete len:235 (+) Transcript_73959:94-798(+)
MTDTSGRPPMAKPAPGLPPQLLSSTTRRQSAFRDLTSPASTRRTSKRSALPSVGPSTMPVWPLRSRPASLSRPITSTRWPAQTASFSSGGGRWAGSFTRITVSLSVPSSMGRPRQPRAHAWCSSSLLIWSRARPCLTKGQTMSTTSWFDIRSKRPSQATISSSSGPPLNGARLLSGNAITLCFSGGSAKLAFRLKSPSARDRLRLPSTRWQGPTLITCPPAARMRLRSPVFSGL